MDKPITSDELAFLDTLNQQANGSKYLLIDDWRDIATETISPIGAFFISTRLMFADLLTYRLIGSKGCKTLITLKGQA